MTCPTSNKKKNSLHFVVFIHVIIIIIMCLNTSSRLKFTAEHIDVKIKVIQSIFTGVYALILHRADSDESNKKRKFVSFIVCICVIIVIIMCMNTSSRLQFTAEHTGVNINVIQPIFTGLQVQNYIVFSATRR